MFIFAKVFTLLEGVKNVKVGACAGSDGFVGSGSAKI